MKEKEITTNIIKRFESRLGELLVCVDGCIEWTGSRNLKGYGILKSNNKRFRAHRIAWALFNNKNITEGLIIMHTCDNPPCVNPDHLKLGTPADNMKDMCKKGRGGVAIGSKNGSAKLKESDVIEIRKKLKNRTGVDIAREYGVGKKTISDVKTGKTWKYV